MKKLTSILLTLAMTAMLFLGGVVATFAADSASVTILGIQDNTKAFEVLRLVNQERAKAGVAPLTMDMGLLDASIKRGAESYMYFSHTRTDGSSCFTVSSAVSGENIALGQRTPAEVMNSWMSSSGHKANILNSSFKTIGISCFYQQDSKTYVWVQNFGRGSAAEPVTSSPGDWWVLSKINIDESIVNVQIAAPKSVELSKGEIYYDFGSYAYNSQWPSIVAYFENQGLDITSANPEIAEVCGTLVNEELNLWSVGIMGKSPGHTKITVSVRGGNAKAVIDVTVSDIDRTYGSNRYATSLAAANRYLDETGADEFNNVVLACGSNYPDALSGGYLAAKKNAPLILTTGAGNDSQIINYVASNIKSSGTVYLLGGTGVITPAFENALKNKGCNVKRLGGANRFETNISILKEAGVTADNNLMICTGYNYADSLSVAALGEPVLFVDSKLTATQKTYLESLDGITECYAIGGTGVVSDAAASGAAKALGKSSYQRIFGANRYATSAMIAEKFFPSSDSALLVYGQNFPDGLSAGPLAYVNGMPILLASSTDTKFAKDYVAKAGVESLIVVAGPSLISNSAVKAIKG